MIGMLISRESIKENYLQAVKKEWLQASELFPDFLIELTPEVKVENETYAKKISEAFEQQVKAFPKTPLGRRKWKKKMQSSINEVLYHETVIGIHASMGPEEIDAFQDELKEFLRHVRRFAPELSFDEIGQALRNYIVYAMFKNIHQIQTGFSMAGFGYSMLYPFTDNFIDSKTYSGEEKADYNKLIHDKILGSEVYPQNAHQKKTCELLDAIESVFPRAKDPTASTLLLMMLEAQEDSIRQQNKGAHLTAEERLDISLYKGGVSVLIDRYLVNKSLTDEEMIFYLGLGFFLQLADDLQDIKADGEQNWQTLLTLDTSASQEEKYVNKLLNFIHNIMNSYQAENNRFKNFVLENCYQLIYTSILGSKEYFREEYLNRIEQYLPVSNHFFKELQNDSFMKQKNQGEYLKLLDIIIFD